LAPSRAGRTDVGRLVVLTGKRRIGKSTVCAEFVALARDEGFHCGGIITLAQDEERHVPAARHAVATRHVVAVRTGDRRRLTHSSGAGAVIQGRFRFSPETIQWAAEAVGRATPCDLLVVDEIGPLEVIRGEGWVGAIDVVREGAYALAVVVVRPELVETVCARLVHLLPEVVSVTHKNRSQLPGRLLSMLGESS